MKFIKINRERRKAPDKFYLKGDIAPGVEHMSKKPHHWIQEIFYTKGNLVLVTMFAANERRDIDERKCA